MPSVLKRALTSSQDLLFLFFLFCLLPTPPGMHVVPLCRRFDNHHTHCCALTRSFILISYRSHPSKHHRHPHQPINPLGVDGWMDAAAQKYSILQIRMINDFL